MLAQLTHQGETVWFGKSTAVNVPISNKNKCTDASLGLEMKINWG